MQSAQGCIEEESSKLLEKLSWVTLSEQLREKGT